MLTIYKTDGSRLETHDLSLPASEACVWYDLMEPSPEEDRYVESVLKISVPTREEMREIEASSRFYQEGGATYMTGFIVHSFENSLPVTSAITFILTGNSLVTVRYANPKAFPMFLQRVAKGDASGTSGAAILIGLLETLIERKADLIEYVQDRTDRMARSIFNFNGRRRKGETSLDSLLKGAGAQGDVIARAQDSATSIERVLHFFETAACEMKCDPRILQRIQTSQKDLSSLSENMRYLSSRLNFLLDATLGMITTEQNQIIKLFSVMAVLLMPPTLVASVYGMNFKHMPELEWVHGYPMALGAMLVSAIVPYLIFRSKHWL